MAGKRSAMRPYGGVSAADRVAERRERLVAAAIRLFGANGFSSTGVKQLCAEAGVTDRYFYESFRNREELFSAAFDRVVGELLAAVGSAALGAAGSPEGQARAAVRAFVEALAADRAKARLLFVEVSAVGGEIAHEARASTRRFAELLAGASRPHLDAATSDSRLAMASLSLIGAMGIVVLEWLDGELEATAEEISDYFVEMLLAAGAAGTETSD